MTFFGKTYSFDKDGNFEGFMKSINVPQETVTKALVFQPSVTFLKNADGTYTYKSEHPVLSKTLNFTLNTPIDDVAFDGSKVKTTFTLEGNTITQEQKSEDGRVLKITREFTDSTLKISFATNLNDTVGVRYYKA